MKQMLGSLPKYCLMCMREKILRVLGRNLSCSDGNFQVFTQFPDLIKPHTWSPFQADLRILCAAVAFPEQHTSGVTVHWEKGNTQTFRSHHTLALRLECQSSPLYYETLSFLWPITDGALVQVHLMVGPMRFIGHSQIHLKVISLVPKGKRDIYYLAKSPYWQPDPWG